MKRGISTAPPAGHEANAPWGEIRSITSLNGHSIILMVITVTIMVPLKLSEKLTVMASSGDFAPFSALSTLQYSMASLGALIGTTL